MKAQDGKSKVDTGYSFSDAYTMYIVLQMYFCKVKLSGYETGIT